MSNGNPKFPPVLIFTIEGRPCCIANFGFMPSRAFSVYALYEEFMRGVAEQDHTDENFFHWLLEQGYGDYIEPEQIPEQATRFLSWELRPTALDFGAAFDIVHKFPSVMTQHLLEQLASGWRTPIFQVAQFSHEDYFRFMKDKMVDDQSVLDLRITVAKSALKAKEDVLIAQHGFTKQFVGAGGRDSQFCYTIGLTVGAGAEIIAFAALPMELMAEAVDKVARELLTKTLKIGERDDLFKLADKVTPLRMKVVHVNAHEALQNYILNTRGTVRRVYQILFADENNVLPDEPGYNVTFTQHLFTPAPTQDVAGPNSWADI